MKRPPKVKTVKVKEARHDFSIFPNFSKTGSVKGMRRLYYGNEAYLIRCGGYIYKVTEEVYNQY